MYCVISQHVQPIKFTSALKARKFLGFADKDVIDFSGEVSSNGKHLPEFFHVREVDLWYDDRSGFVCLRLQEDEDQTYVLVEKVDDRPGQLEKLKFQRAVDGYTAYVTLFVN